MGSKATRIEILTRSLNKLLSYEDRQNPELVKRVEEAFWKGTSAQRKLLQNVKKRQRKDTNGK